MTNMTTPTKGLAQQTIGGNDDEWGTILNDTIRLIDTALGGTLDRVLTDDVILTALEIENTGYHFRGTLVNPVTVIFPTYFGLAVIRNSADKPVSCGMAGGRFVTIATHGCSAIWSDGTDFTDVSQFLSISNSLRGIDAKSGSGEDGGSLGMVGGAGDGAGAGGAIFLTGGTSGNTGVGGALYLNGGLGNTIGGDIHLEAGAGSSTGDGGDIWITAGTGKGSGHRAGDVNITAYKVEDNATHGDVRIILGGGGLFISDLTNIDPVKADQFWLSNGVLIRSGSTLANAVSGAFLPLSGGTLTGPLTITHATDANIYLKSTGTSWPGIKWNSTQPGTAAGYFESQRNGLPRWGVLFGDSLPESGSNAGTNFTINSFNDDGSFLRSPFSITRATGAMRIGNNPQNTLTITPGTLTTNAISLNASGTAGLTIVPPVTFSGSSTFNAPLAITVSTTGVQPLYITTTSAQWPSVNFDAYVSTAAAGYIQSRRSGNPRWSVTLGTSTAETGSNSGSDFVISRYDDTGAALVVAAPPLTIARATGSATFGSPLTVGTGAANALTITPGTAAGNSITLAQSGTGGLILPPVSSPLTVGTGTQNALKVTAGASASSSILMAPTGTGPVSLAATVYLGGGVNTVSAAGGTLATDPVGFSSSSAGGLMFGTGGKIAFNGSTPVTKPSIAGACAGNTAIKALLTALASYGLITDSTTA
jgi:hypothetical protein